MAVENLVLSPAPKSGEIGKVLVCFGLLYKYKQDVPTSGAETYIVVTNVLEPADEVFSGAVLKFNEQDQPYFEVPVLGRDPWQISELLGIMKPLEVLQAYRRGWHKEYPDYNSDLVVIYKNLRLAAHKGSKSLSTLPPIR